MIVEYANRLTARGHQVILVIPGGTIDREIEKEVLPGVRVRQSQVTRGRRTDPVQMAHLAWSLARAVPPSDVIISTHTPTTVATLLASWLWKRGRLVWLFQDYREMFVGRPYESWLMRHALRWHERALVVSECSRQELLAYSPGEVIVVGEGLSHPEILCPLPVKTHAGAGDQRTVLFLGDMRPRKGLSDFLQAAALVHDRLKGLRLLIVSKEECQVDTNVPFEFVYRPERTELARLYATCDLFVSASWQEGFGLPPLEAMACGAPVVLTDSGGVREYARPGENCLMTPARDPVTLGEAMFRVLTDTALAEKLRCNGPLTAAQFTWGRAVDRFEHALVSLFE